MSLSLNVEARSESTKSEIKQMRLKGKVPGVVYGKKVGTTPISIGAKELMALVRTNPHAIVSMDIPAVGNHQVMIHQIQRDPLDRSLLHIDFHQINMNEPVKTTVQLEFIGEPVGVKEGGILQIKMHELEIRCLPDRIPETLHVDVNGLELGNSLLVSDLQLSNDIELKSDPTEVVVSIVVPQKEEPEAVIEEETDKKIAETKNV